MPPTSKRRIVLPISPRSRVGVTLGALVLALVILAIPGCGGREEHRAKHRIAVAIKDLSDSQVRVRVEAADSLARLWPWAKEAVPALVKALEDPEGDVR